MLSFNDRNPEAWLNVEIAMEKLCSLKEDTEQLINKRSGLRHCLCSEERKLARFLGCLFPLGKRKENIFPFFTNFSSLPPSLLLPPPPAPSPLLPPPSAALLPLPSAPPCISCFIFILWNQVGSSGVPSQEHPYCTLIGCFHISIPQELEEWPHSFFLLIFPLSNIHKFLRYHPTFARTCLGFHRDQFQGPPKTPMSVAVDILCIKWCCLRIYPAVSPHT